MSDQSARFDDGPAQGHTAPLTGFVQVRATQPPTKGDDSSPTGISLVEASTRFRRRKAANTAMLGFSVLCAIIAIVPLVAIAIYVLVQGVSSLSPDFFTHAESQVDTSGFGTPLGIGNTIVGTLLVVLVACLIGLPIGLFSGIYLAEYGRGRFADTVRFLADVMAGLPSIVAGIVGYAIVVVYFGFSAFAGGLALGLLMFPVVTRATEEVLRLVPQALREGGLALGVPRWRVIASIVVPSAASGIITSMLLGIARVTGETAPLLFTVGANQYFEWNPFQKVDTLTVTIYNYSQQPDPAYHRMAFAGALILVVVIVALNMAARLLFRQRVQGRT